MIKIKKLRKINELFTDYHMNSYDIDNFDGKYWRATTESGAKIRFSILPIVTGCKDFVTFEYLVEYPQKDDTFKPLQGEKINQEKLKIFNTVLSFFESKVYENQYAGFNFSGEKSGPLAKLYSTLVKKLNFDNYNMIQNENHKSKVFSFIRKDFIGLALNNKTLLTNNSEYILKSDANTKDNCLYVEFYPLIGFGKKGRNPIEHFDFIIDFFTKNKVFDKIILTKRNYLFSNFPNNINTIMNNFGYDFVEENESLVFVKKN